MKLKINPEKTDLIFDYDGTIHNSALIYVPAFCKMYKQLIKDGFAQTKEWKEEEVVRWVRYTSEEMWRRFMPELPKEAAEVYSRMVGNEMTRLVKTGKASLYPNALETLQDLKAKGYRLILLSNCGRDYIKLHAKMFGFGHLFTYFCCSGDFGHLPKGEILRRVRPELRRECIVIGDRYQDMEAAKLLNFEAIGCAYGHGEKEELAYASVLINSLNKLTQIL